MLDVEFEENLWVEGLSRKGTVALMESAFHSWLIVMKLTKFIVHKSWGTVMDFQVNPFNERRSTAEEVLSSWSKVPFIIDQSRTKLQVL